MATITQQTEVLKIDLVHPVQIAGSSTGVTHGHVPGGPVYKLADGNWVKLTLHPAGVLISWTWQGKRLTDLIPYANIKKVVVAAEEE